MNIAPTSAYRILDIAQTEKLLASSGRNYTACRAHPLAVQRTQLLEACRAQGISPAWK